MNPSEQNGKPSTRSKGRDKQGEVLLVLAARSGDSHAFVELSKPYSKRTLLMLYRITKNWQDAEDVLQDALIKAFLHLDSFQCKSAFPTWFTRIAVNCALMFLRKRRRFLEIAIDDPGEACAGRECDLKDFRDNPEQSFERQQRSNLIHLGTMQLPPELRKVVELRHSRDLSDMEIAQCLGISLAATKSRLSRARMALRVFVQREVGKPLVRAEQGRTTQLESAQNRDSDIKPSPTRSRTKKRAKPKMIARNLVPINVMNPTGEETNLFDEELSTVGSG